jgi:hypothetical protein
MRSPNEIESSRAIHHANDSALVSTGPTVQRLMSVIGNILILINALEQRKTVFVEHSWDFVEKKATRDCR